MENKIEPLVKGFKYRIYPNKSTREYLEKTFGCSRKVYNYFLDKSSKSYEAWENDKSLPKPSVNYNALSAELTLLKRNPDFEYLQEPPAPCLQQSLKHLAIAFNRLFSKSVKSGYPKFKSKHGYQSASLTEGAYWIRNNKFIISKDLTPIKVKWGKRSLPTTPKTAVISKSPSGKYYVSFTCEFIPQPTAGTKITGIDLGLTDFIYCSDGTSVPNPKYYLKADKRLKRLQRSLSRKKKGSKNRNKARIRVALQHEKLANMRTDFLHKLSSNLVNENQVIVVEDLAVANMVKNHRLARSISNACWSKFKSMLEYKVIQSRHSVLMIADRFFPSTQNCSCCGLSPTKKIVMGIDKWVCEYCGAAHHRDHNASKNLENLAYTNMKYLDEYPDKRIIRINAGGVAFRPLPA